MKLIKLLYHWHVRLVVVSATIWLLAYWLCTKCQLSNKAGVFGVGKKRNERVRVYRVGLILLSFRGMLQCFVSYFLQAECVVMKLLGAPSLDGVHELKRRFSTFFQARHEARAIHQLDQPEGYHCHCVRNLSCLQLLQIPVNIHTN